MSAPFEIKHPGLIGKVRGSTFEVEIACGEQVQANYLFFVLYVEGGGVLLVNDMAHSDLDSCTSNTLLGYGLKIYPEKGWTENWVAPRFARPINIPTGIVFEGVWHRLEYALRAKLWARPGGYDPVYVRSLVYATKEDSPAGWHEFSVENDLTEEQLNRLRLGSMRCGVDNNVSLLDYQGKKI